MQNFGAFNNLALTVIIVFKVLTTLCLTSILIRLQI